MVARVNPIGYKTPVNEMPFGHALINLLMPGTLFQPPRPPKAVKRDPDALLTLEEAADFLRLTPQALQEACRRGEVTHARLDYRNYRFRFSDLDEYLMHRTFKAKTP